LIWIKSDDRFAIHLAVMRPVLFQCPHTKLNVQAWLSPETAQDSPRVYETVNCPACTRLHFIERASGRLLGDHTK
jgi:hypothetical protein